MALECPNEIFEIIILNIVDQVHIMDIVKLDWTYYKFIVHNIIHLKKKK